MLAVRGQEEMAFRYDKGDSDWILAKFFFCQGNQTLQKIAPSPEVFKRHLDLALTDVVERFRGYSGSAV